MGERFDDGDDPPSLVVGRDGVGAGARRFAADVDEIGALGASGTAVCACPSTEADLADGVGAFGRLRDAGSPLCLGSDQHAIIDLLAEARLLEAHERLITGERGRFRPAELVPMLRERGGQLAREAATLVG